MPLPLAGSGNQSGARDSSSNHWGLGFASPAIEDLKPVEHLEMPRHCRHEIGSGSVSSVTVASPSVGSARVFSDRTATSGVDLTGHRRVHRRRPYNGAMLIETKDSTALAVDVWGAGRPVVLLHAWGLDAHMWNAQLPALVGAGFQVVTIDQRGHGRSGRSPGGYDLDTMAADVLGVLDTLDLHDVVLIGQSMGGAVVAHAVGGLGSPRVGRAVLSAPITPCLTIGPDNQLGLPADVFAANRAAMAADIAGWLDANSAGYWGDGEDRWPLHTRYTVDAIHGRRSRCCWRPTRRSRAPTCGPRSRRSPCRRS